MQFILNSLAQMNMEQGMYTPERSPTIAAGARGQHSASILLHDEEQGKDALNIDGEGPAKYDSPTPEELAATQKIDEEKVLTTLNISLHKNNTQSLI